MEYELTWTCMVCGKRRPDEFISVYNRDDSSEFHLTPGSVISHIRYCNDNEACKEKAKIFNWEERIIDESS